MFRFDKNNVSDSPTFLELSEEQREMLFKRADAKAKGRVSGPITNISIVIFTTIIAYQFFGIFWVFLVWILDAITFWAVDAILYKIRFGRMCENLLKEYE